MDALPPRGGTERRRAEANRTRCVLAISAPSRGYAAALCAADAVLAAYEIESVGNALGWFRELSALPRGTPLTVREGQRIKRGLFVGVGERAGVTALGIQLEAAARALFVLDDAAEPLVFGGRRCDTVHAFCSAVRRVVLDCPPVKGA